jgi:hypothetical protein
MNDSKETTGSSQPEETIHKDIGDNTEPIIGHFGMRIEAMVDDESIDMNQVRELLSRLADAHIALFTTTKRCPGGDNQASTKGISWENLNGLDDAALRKYLNLSTIQWGNPRSANAKLRLRFSFWVDCVGSKNVGKLKKAMPARNMEFLKELGWYLKSHTLHQSQEVNVAFILGRHPEKTYKDGLRDTVSDFINQQSNGSTPTIYLDVVYSKIVVKDTKVPVLAIQCGMNDGQTIDNILKGGAQHPTIDI